MGPLYQSTFLVVLSTLLAGATPLTATQAQASTAAAVPSADSLMRHVYALADDSMRGRGTGTEGYDMAARYVAKAFRALGVIPDPSWGGSGLERYFQRFEYESPPQGWSGASLESYNVIGIVPGTDRRLAAERVVVGAHLDHMGIQNGHILNGASDNASGVAVLLEVARLMSRSPSPRTVIFAAFGAEEYGLLGSSAFVSSIADNELRVVANINVDDVGHLDVGRTGHPILAAFHQGSMCLQLYDLVEAYGDKSGLTITDSDDNNLFTRSDHYSFYRAGIPVIFFGSGGEHRWLHTPQDDPEAMDGDQLQEVATVVYESVRIIAERIDVCKSR